MVGVDGSTGKDQCEVRQQSIHSSREAAAKLQHLISVGQRPPCLCPVAVCRVPCLGVFRGELCQSL